VALGAIWRARPSCAGSCTRENQRKAWGPSASRADPGEWRAAEELDRRQAGEGREVQLRGLGEARQVGDHQQRLVAEPAQEGEHAVVFRLQKLDRAAAERRVAFAQRDHPAHPPEQRVGIGLLHLHVHRLIVELRVDDHRQV